MVDGARHSDSGLKYLQQENSEIRPKPKGEGKNRNIRWACSNLQQRKRYIVDGFSAFIGLIAGAFAGGYIMHERGYTRGRLDAMDKQDRVDTLAIELREMQSEINDIKIEQEVLDIMIKQIKNG